MKVRPERPALSSCSSSADSADSRKYSHHTVLFSRRCQTRVFARSQCACCSRERSAGSTGTLCVSRSIKAATFRCQSLRSSPVSQDCGIGRSITAPVARSSERTFSSQSRSLHADRQSSLLYPKTALFSFSLMPPISPSSRPKRKRPLSQTLWRRSPLLRLPSPGCFLFPCRRSSQSSLDADS
jgi:hypothetical protein